MKMYILADNHAGKVCSAEWGFSLYIQASTNILLDFGASNLFLKNAEKIGVDPLNSEYLVLSHGHWDHGNGLEFLPKKKLICHPEAFIRRFSGKRQIGLPFDLEEGKEKFDLILSSEPYEIDENITFLGEIPRLNDFEAKDTIFRKEDGSKDFVLDDTGLVIKTEKGLVVVSGCAHAGICNTVDYAKEITKTDEVLVAFGGFHLKGNDEITVKTINYLKTIGVKYAIPTHCTQFPAQVEFYKHFGSEQVSVGQVLEI